MFELIKLRYVLNKDHFFSSSILLKDISDIQKKILYRCFSLFKMICFIFIFFILKVLILSNQSKLYLFDIVQLIFFVVCTLYFANLSESENSKTHIKDFLIGANFDSNEKVINRKKLSLVIFFEASTLCFLTWILLIPLVNHVAKINLLIYVILSIVNLISVLVMNYYPRRKSGSKYWFMQYVLVGLIAFGIVQFWNYFKQDMSLNRFETIKNSSYILIFGLIYQIISIIFSFRKVTLKNQNVGGLLGDFIEKYVDKSAIVYIVPIVFLNVVTISELSQTLIIVAYISLFVMPNVVSLNFLNYYKMVGDSRNILVKYGQVILCFQLALALISGILCGLNLVSLLLLSFLLIVVATLRISIAILVVKSKHKDSQKTDYFALSMFVPVILIASLAFFLR